MWDNGFSYIHHQIPEHQEEDSASLSLASPTSCFYSKGKQGSERESDWPQGTKIVSGPNKDFQLPFRSCLSLHPPDSGALYLKTCLRLESMSKLTHLAGGKKLSLVSYHLGLSMKLLNFSLSDVR